MLSNSVGFTSPTLHIPPIRYSPVFQATGLVFTGTNATYPTYNSYYVKQGYLVSFWIDINLSTVTNFGTGQFKVDLPVPPHNNSSNHFSGWAWADPTQAPDALNGHVQIQADHMPGSQTLDLHWLGGDTPTPKPVIEHLFYQGYPITLTTASKIYVGGTYFTDIL